jgi:hypothetical protein
MKRMLKYFFSIGILLLITYDLCSQSQRIKGLRLGVDLSRFSLYYFAPEREAYEFSGDFEVARDLYVVGEYGSEKISLEKPTFNYKSDGNYFRLGVDWNFLESENPNDYEMVYGGIRFGYASLYHSADNIIISDPYWGSVASASTSEINYNAQWVEILTGIRAELFRNFFIGWSVRGRIRLTHSSDDILKPYIIPGYGNGIKKATIGFNFSIFYRIPLYKKTVNYKKTEQ